MLLLFCLVFATLWSIKVLLRPQTIFWSSQELHATSIRWGMELCNLASRRHRAVSFWHRKQQKETDPCSHVQLWIIYYLSQRVMLSTLVLIGPELSFFAAIAVIMTYKTFKRPLPWCNRSSTSHIFRFDILRECRSSFWNDKNILLLKVHRLRLAICSSLATQ